MKNTFTTDLDINSCKTLINELIQQEKSNRVYGKVGKKNNRFWVVKRNFNYQNSWQRYFYGELTISNNKTTLKGNFKLNKVVKIILIYCYTFILFIGILMIFNLAKSLIMGDIGSALHLTKCSYY